MVARREGPQRSRASLEAAAGQSADAEGGVAERLAVQLEADGELVARGGFTLALEQARDKLATRRLADPQAFVLFLVEAAHLLPGCHAISFEIGGAGTTVVLEGATLSRDRARSPLDALLEKEDEGEFGVRALAVGINAMLGIAARAVSLDLSTSDGGVVCVELPSEGPASVSEHDAGRASPSLILRLHEGPAWRVWRAMGGTEAGARRRELLRTRCAYASLPLLVDGERLDRGPRLEFVRERVEVHEGDRLVAHGGWPEEAFDQPACLLLLANGVIVERAHYPKWRRGFVALVEAEDLRRDVSLTSFVRDEIFEDRAARIRRAHERVPEVLIPIRYDGILQNVSPNRHLPAGIFGVGGLIGGGVALGMPGIGGVAALAWAGVCGVWHLRVHRHFARVKREGRRAVGVVLAVHTNQQETQLDLEVEDRGQRFETRLALDITGGAAGERVRVGQRVFLRICADTGLVLFGRPP